MKCKFKTWIACLLAILLVSCSPGPTVEDFAKIEKGMSMFQVESIVGKPSEIVEYDEGRLRAYVYEIEGSKFVLTYEDDAVNEIVTR